MINPCVKCPERDRCEGMNQPCKQGKAYQKWKAGCKRVAEHTKQVNKRAEKEVQNGQPEIIRSVESDTGDMQRTGKQT